MALIMKGKVQFWATSDWTVKHELPIGTPAVNSVAFSKDGQWLAVGAADKKIRIWSQNK
jgi:WD40 repeat protein